MLRRGFLGFIARLGAGLGVSSSCLGQDALQALTVIGSHPRGGGLKAPTLVFSLDGEWSILTDPNNVGCEQSWFRAPHPDTQATRVPVVRQSVP
jgi:hypothetical protein